MAQFSRPDADLFNGGYKTQIGAGASLYTVLDEPVADDADFIQSPVTPTNAVYVTHLTPVADPQTSNGHSVSFRYATDQASGGEPLDLTVELRQGYVDEATPGLLIARKTILAVRGNVFVEDAIALTALEADSITDYTALAVRVVWNRP
jgi:hypothetical protein